MQNRDFCYNGHPKQAQDIKKLELTARGKLKLVVQGFVTVTGFVGLIVVGLGL